jgi:regulator of nucleoside diphosphate kinase
MGEQAIILTDYDAKRLEVLVCGRKRATSRDRGNLLELEYELSRAARVGTRHVPPNIVTMNTRVHLKDMDSKQDMIVTLVYPEDVRPAEGRLSVLSPIGTAILGYSEGDTIEWPAPGGVKRIKIHKILYQPEASGDYHL